MKNYKPNPIRTLARSNYWQTLYIRAKEIGNIQLFKNCYSFSDIQVLFLQWLEIYNSLYMDLSTGQQAINMDIIKDDIRVDAYLYYKRKRRENKLFDKQESKSEQKSKNVSGVPSVSFK